MRFFLNQYALVTDTLKTPLFPPKNILKKTHINEKTTQMQKEIIFTKVNWNYSTHRSHKLTSALRKNKWNLSIAMTTKYIFYEKVAWQNGLINFQETLKHSFLFFPQMLFVPRGRKYVKWYSSDVKSSQFQHFIHYASKCIPSLSVEHHKTSHTCS